MFKSIGTGSSLVGDPMFYKVNSASQCLSLRAAYCAILCSLFLTPSLKLMAEEQKCLYISSYHQGYAWSDGVEKGLKGALGNSCTFKQFNMDTKRLKQPEQIKKSADMAIEIIEKWKPDVVITSDDNAAKHLIVPHFKNNSLPFVFSGVNWTVEEYGFPFDNVTGIVEVAPIKPMLEEAKKLTNAIKAVYIGADTITEEKNYQRNFKEAKKMGLTLDKILITDFDEWKTEFKRVQEGYAFLVNGSSSGIKNWDDKKASEYARSHAKRLSFTNMKWMMPVTTIGYTKIPAEHGEWAGLTALEILKGTKPIDIPIITNRKWDLWVNEELENRAVDKVNESMKKKYKKVASID